MLSLIFYFNKKKTNIFFLFISGLLIFYTSERTALFLYLVLIFSYFLIIKHKIKFLLIAIFSLLILFSLNYDYRYKYINYTLKQLGFISTNWNKEYNGIIRYYSKEHERSIIWNDNELNISWPQSSEILLSHKDAMANTFNSAELFS